MSGKAAAALTSTSSSSPDAERNQARVLAKLLYLLCLNIGAAEMNLADLFRPHRVQQLTHAEREALLKMHMSLRGWRRYAEELERTWKARLESFPKS